MGLFFVGLIGFLVCLVVLLIKVAHKKPKKVFGILTTVFLILGIAGMVQAMNTPAVDPKTMVGTGSTVSPDTTSDSEDDSKTEKEVASGEVFDSIKNVWKDFDITEVYDEEVGTTLARINVYVKEDTPLNNARKYLDIVLDMREKCAEAFIKADYNNVVVHFNVRDFDGKLFFYTELSPKDGKYQIDGFAPMDIISLSDESYQKALQAALDEI
mgnify:FL=1